MTGFGKVDPNVLANTAHAVAKGIGGHPAYFVNRPVDPSTKYPVTPTLSSGFVQFYRTGVRPDRTNAELHLQDPLLYATTGKS